MTPSGLRRRSAARIYDAEIRSSIYGAWVRIPPLAKKKESPKTFFHDLLNHEKIHYLHVFIRDMPY